MVQFYDDYKFTEKIRKNHMSYFDGIFKRSSAEYCDSTVAEPLDSCMVFNISKGGRLAASRMRSGISAPASIKEIMSCEELAFLTDYLGSYAERPVVVSTSLGFAVAITALYPSTSLCVLSIPTVGGENFLRVAKYKKWDVALSPIAKRRQLRRTGIREGHLEDSERLWNMLGACFDPRFDADCTRSDFLRARTVSLTEYVSRRARITLDGAVAISDEFDLSLYVAFVLLFTLSGRAGRAEECAKISLHEHARGVEAVIVEKASRGCTCIENTISEICGRGNIPFECFYEDGRVYTRIVPVRRDWAYLGIKAPEDN